MICVLVFKYMLNFPSFWLSHNVLKRSNNYHNIALTMMRILCLCPWLNTLRIVRKFYLFCYDEHVFYFPELGIFIKCACKYVFDVFSWSFFSNSIVEILKPMKNWSVVGIVKNLACFFISNTRVVTLGGLSMYVLDKWIKQAKWTV